MSIEGVSDHSKNRIAILGGSFDPVHFGHLGMAEQVIDGGLVDKVIFVPCFVSPFKSTTVATPDQRLTMLQLGLADTSWEWAEVSRYEIDRPGPSYSWETAEHFTRAQPEAKFFWIVGTDQWEQLEDWARPDKLRELLHFIVLTRGDSEVKSREGWEHSVLSYEHPASSTMIRSDRESHAEWLPPLVLNYCRANHLYTGGEKSPE